MTTFASLSNLQLSLAGIGVAAVLAVWGYNRWQEHRQRRQGNRVFRQDHADALLGGAARDDEEPFGSDERVEPIMPPLAASEERADEWGLPVELADPAIDTLVCLEAPQPVAGQAIWAAQRQLLGNLEGRLRWLVHDGEQWRHLAANDTLDARRYVAALQLADRGGPVGEVEASKFVFGLRELAETFHAAAELPSAPDLLDRARALDAFCARVDWRLGISVVARSGHGFDWPKARALLEATGLVLREDGMFHALDEDGQTLYTVGRLGGLPFSDDDAEAPTQGFTFAIDVPRVTDGPVAFDRLLSLARKLTQAQDGLLVDDKRTPLDEAVLKTIRAKIGEFQQNMATHDIAAGSGRALRLYS